MSKTAQQTTGPKRPVRTPARAIAFAVLAVLLLTVGAFLAFGKLAGRPGTSAAGEAVSIQSSMAGFTPAQIHVRAGSTATFTWWTQDSALHLQGGVHTMIAPALGLNETLPANSKRTLTWAVPNKPGTYDVYCDTCCGGKAAPAMHGTIVIDPAA